MNDQYSNSEKTITDPLAQIEGLDLNEGLLHTANNRTLYETLLKAFVANNSNTVAKIRAALADDDLATAKRTAHSLKGLAATIGAPKLHKAALATENAIHNSPPEVALKNLQALEKLIEPLLQHIRLVLMPDSDKPAQ